MTREEVIEFGNMWLQMNEDSKDSSTYTFFQMAIKVLEQEPYGMTAEEYRQRMIQAFHNADTGELITVCVLPTEKEFEHLEWLLKNHYKKEPCDDCISRQAVLEYIEGSEAELGHGSENELVCQDIKELPPVAPHRLCKVLDNENVLDKIRAEIESQRKEAGNRYSEDDKLQAYYHGLNDGLKDARDIIDKYKTESEDETDAVERKTK